MVVEGIDVDALIDAARLCLISHMMPGDTCYRESRRYHPNMLFLGPGVRPGQPFAGPYWPIMWPACA